jgi:hypothetical protein
VWSGFGLVQIEAKFIDDAHDALNHRWIETIHPARAVLAPDEARLPTRLSAWAR